jgi:uncharacterized protein YkwD
MASKNYIAHAGPDGQTSASLIMDADAEFQGLLGENIAAQYYTRASGVQVEYFARRFVATWLASPAHKENLAFPAYNRSGVGAAVNGQMVYVTLLFATDLGLAPSAGSIPQKVIEHRQALAPAPGVVIPAPLPRPAAR